MMGTPFTADDVLYSYRRITQDGSEMRNFLANVETIEEGRRSHDPRDHQGSGSDPAAEPLAVLHRQRRFKEANNAFQVASAAAPRTSPT
jgi:ABC-type transport system substrate-binding protein